MDINIKKFIETNIDMLQNEFYNEFFLEAQQQFDPMRVNELGSCLEEAGIFCIPHMSFIPTGYYLYSDISTYNIHSDIKVIMGQAFRKSNLETITIPSNVIHINHYAFDDCFLLEEVKIEEGLVNLSGGVFQDCTKLKKITLPKSLKTIGAFVFNNCINLKQIYYNGTVHDWMNNIIIDRRFAEDAVIEDIICSDGVVETEFKQYN